jgi:hypothetical protein
MLPELLLWIQSGPCAVRISTLKRLRRCTKAPTTQPDGKGSKGGLSASAGGALPVLFWFWRIYTLG